ncbi:MAG TPA: hypothetical protein VFR08_01880 [Candidatus Angelobacter sp.]|nr:hypothetical protein [Candidatus Angelobacter sp.]
MRKPFYQDYLLVEQLLDIIFTFFTLNVLAPPDAAPVPEVELVVEEVPVPEVDSEPVPGVPITRI